MNFSEFIVPSIAAAVYLVFLMIRPILPDKGKPFIPLMAGILGIAFMAWYETGFSFTICLTGLASGLAATGIDQAVKIPQYVETNSDDDRE